MSLKEYKNIPVIITENHHEVIPHIHRAIASRHLPLEGIKLLHLDSHPDMLIPIDMNADEVYDKDKLYDAMSIENWIIPAVYAGHISEVIWMKATWCDQITDQCTKFHVGKDIKTGCIRLTSKENYFVSETLYVPETQLKNAKELSFCVATLQPEAVSVEGCSDSCRKVGRIIVTQQCSVTHGKDNPLHVSSCNHEESIQAEMADDKVQVCTQETNIQPVTEQNIGVKKTNDETSPKRRKLDSGEYCSITSERKLSENIAEEDKVCLTAAKLLNDKCRKYFSRSLKDSHYILDIDLDFFSTQNPFKEIYSERQFNILKELYKFEKPRDGSEEALQECVAAREKQLTSLENVFTYLTEDPKTDIQHPTCANLIKELTDSLQSQSSEPINYEMLHSAGCTCDDTELPSHVSTPTEIRQLVSAVKRCILDLSHPTFITISRSSVDEYCPSFQVDAIQAIVLKMLQDVYKTIDITYDYESQD